MSSYNEIVQPLTTLSWTTSYILFSFSKRLQVR